MSKKLYLIIFILFFGAISYGLFFRDQPSGEKSDIEQVQKEEAKEELSETYSGSGVSFKYPSEYKIVEDESDMDQQNLVTFEKAPELGFQLFNIPFDEEGPVTPERIQEDIPDTVINDPEYTEVGGVKILTFYSYEETVGDTFEAWFVHGGKLYQMTGYKGLDGLIRKIIGTMTFE